ncbi:hypothetical protein CUMW_005890 [Citrus unshiu]|nr:hypothetical protein CUMW_005890 [Citrus unshiu]
MERKNLTFGSIEELKEPLIVKEEDLESIDTSPESCSIDMVPQVIRASTSKDMEMENNNLITFASIKERKELILDIEEILEPQAECCICRVPKDLRKVNEEAYTPQAISIGPLHHGKAELSYMEKQKIRYVTEFSKRITEKTWQEFINFIEENEQRIRNCYAEMLKFEKIELIAMILYDAVFIIEYFLRWRNHAGFKSDFLLNNRPVRASIRRDFQLLENQLPYFVLKGLYKLAFDSRPNQKGNPSLFLLSCGFFYDSMFNGSIPEEVEVIEHFTDLRRYVITKMHRYHAIAKAPKLRGAKKDIHCVVKLHESGVIFRRFKDAECLIDIRFKKPKLPQIILASSELQIPRIGIYDGTECLIRNVMALEQCHYPQETVMCNYISLMDRLIDTEGDVNLLVEAGIISNGVGDIAKIAKMFNQLCQHISYSSASCYYDVFMNLQAHYNDPWNHAKATLKRVYFTNLWTGTGTIAAVVLLVLTLIQTICSIRSV